MEKIVIGSLVKMPVDGCIGVVIGMSDWLWGNTYTVIPIESTAFYEKGAQQSILKDHCKPVKHRVEKIKKKSSKKL